jgi:hypothetical protein
MPGPQFGYRQCLWCVEAPDEDVCFVHPMKSNGAAANGAEAPLDVL